MSDSNEQPELPRNLQPSVRANFGEVAAVLIWTGAAFFTLLFPVGMIALELEKHLFVDVVGVDRSERMGQVFEVTCCVSACAACLVGYMVKRGFRKPKGN